MEVTILLPLSIYDAFMDKCPEATTDYAVLKNGVINRIPKGDHFERIVEIHCDKVDANNLLASASRFCPEAFDHIAKAIARPSKRGF